MNKPHIRVAREWYERAIATDPGNRPALLNLSALDVRASYGDELAGEDLEPAVARERARRRLQQLRRIPRRNRDPVWARATYLLAADIVNWAATSVTIERLPTATGGEPTTPIVDARPASSRPSHSNEDARSLAVAASLAKELGFWVERRLVLPGPADRRTFARDIESVGLLLAACAFELTNSTAQRRLDQVADVVPKRRRWWNGFAVFLELRRADAASIVARVTSWEPLPARATYNLACFWATAGPAVGRYDAHAIAYLERAIDDGSEQLAALAARDPYLDPLRDRRPHDFQRALQRRRY